MLAAYFRPRIGWVAVLRRTVAEIDEDRCFGLAAQLAFYFFLSLFPALLFLVALVGLLPVQEQLEQFLFGLEIIAPREVIDVVREQLRQSAAGSGGSILTVGVVGAIWSSSAAMVAIIDTLNDAFDVVERRPWWKRRIVAVGLTLGLAVFILTSFVLLLLGPGGMRWAAGYMGLDPAFATAWRLLRWPVIVFLLVLAVDLVYHLAPNRRARWVWFTPGSLLATGLWIVTSMGFKVYVQNYGQYSATYGALGGMLVLLLWFYLSALALLVGAELDGVLYQAWLRADPERVAGTRRGSGRGAA